MADDFTDAFDAPFVYPLPDGLKATFAKFDLEELAELAASIRADRLAAADQIIASEQLDATERYRAKQEAMWTQVLDNDVFAYVQSPKGTLEVLHKSLEMAGTKSADDRKSLLKRIPPLTKSQIALVVTGLAVPSKKAKEVRAEDGGEPSFKDAEEVDKDESPLGKAGLTPPSA